MGRRIDRRYADIGITADVPTPRLCRIFFKYISWKGSRHVLSRQKLILFGERSLKRALHHYELHYHQERNHQGKDNLVLLPSPTLPLNRKQGKVRCRERLGGLLKYYEREAL